MDGDTVRVGLPQGWRHQKDDETPGMWMPWGWGQHREEGMWGCHWDVDTMGTQTPPGWGQGTWTWLAACQGRADPFLGGMLVLLHGTAPRAGLSFQPGSIPHTFLFKWLL